MKFTPKIIFTAPIFLTILACSGITENKSAVQSGQTATQLPLECTQADGDSWYRIATTGDRTAIIYTNDSDESKLEFYDRTIYSESAKEITSDSFRIELKSPRGYASLYDLKSNKVLTDILECQTVKDLDIDSWANDILYPTMKYEAMVCYQADGDDRYDVKTINGRTAIIHTNDSDIKSLEYFDASKTFADTKTLSAGRFILNYQEDNDSTLYKKVGNTKQLITDILECDKDYTDLNVWVNAELKKSR